MGTCFSSNSELLCPTSSPSPTAQVISLNGDLHQYKLPAFVFQVLQAEDAAASAAANSNTNSKNSPAAAAAIFLCNSDRLCYDEYIPELDFDHPLQANQIYFVLPHSKLQQPLSSRDMAALAVKASLAIQNASKNQSQRRNNKARISPVLLVAQSLSVAAAADDKHHHHHHHHHNNNMNMIKLNELEAKPKPNSSSSSSSASAKPPPQPAAAGFSRSASIRKLQRYTSKRAKLAVRSFKLRLSTIYEGSVL